MVYLTNVYIAPDVSTNKSTRPFKYNNFETDSCTLDKERQRYMFMKCEQVSFDETRLRIQTTASLVDIITYSLL